ncbi:hypothetical protein Q1Z72_19430 [Pseudomonas qingdaonensis]|uniref:hypothetical protein n=1 Tax=Pseudomonas qingdaonensis TaxID=2056231 RepID=UPI00265F7D58|nr:hypothetical protein [Pseudomonas qingdaonensis]WKL65461.1 hypothetical protein Q1Z72_19430 [Pseudomonas qingdaonensis]
MRIAIWIGILLLSGAAFAAKPGDTSGEDFEAFSKEICRKENSFKSGFDSRLYGACLKSMLRSINKVESLNSQYRESFYVDYSYPFCYLWGHEGGLPNINSISFCLEEEVAAIGELRDYSQKFGFDKVLSISQRSLANQRSWAKARNQVRSELGPLN